MITYSHRYLLHLCEWQSTIKYVLRLRVRTLLFQTSRWRLTFKQGNRKRRNWTEQANNVHSCLHQWRSLREKSWCCFFLVMSTKFQSALALSALGLLLIQNRRKRIRRNRTKWVRSWIQQRTAQVAFHNPCRELETTETSDFARLFPSQFHMLKELLTPHIRRQNTNYRDCISVEERLMVTLRFLETGGQAKCCAIFTLRL